MISQGLEGTAWLGRVKYKGNLGIKWGWDLLTFILIYALL